MKQRPLKNLGATRMRRKGIGIAALALIAAGLVLAVSVISTGGRGLWFTDDGFLSRPKSPASSNEAEPAPQRSLPTPSAPGRTEVEALKQAADEAHRELERALASGDRTQIQAAREVLAKRQAAFKAALSQ